MNLSRMTVGLVVGLGSVLAGTSVAVANTAKDSPGTTQECYVGTYSRDVVPQIGSLAGTIHIAGKWCHDGHEVVTAQLLDTYAETMAPFSRWVQDLSLSNGGAVVNGEARIWQQFRLESVVPTRWLLITQPFHFCARIVVDQNNELTGDDQCWAW